MAGERTLSYAGADQDQPRTFASPFLVVAFDCEAPLSSPVRLSLAEVDRVVIGRGDARVWSRQSEAGCPTLRLTLADSWLSGQHATIERRGESWQLQDDNSKNGTFVAGQPQSHIALSDGDLIEVGNTMLLFRDCAPRRFDDRPDLVAGDARHAGLATLNPELAMAFEPIERLARAGLPLIIGGETGVGKEITARAVHDLSGRSGPFIALNCGALPETLIEAELFGAKRGAYSGATVDRPGLVRAAHGGTLFLDEIAELPASAQVKLLRVLQEGEVTPLGATRPVPVDFRVVAASHRSLPQLVLDGQFRADLHARLAGAQVQVPPLRVRREDIGHLTAAMLERWLGAQAGQVRFERDCARALFGYEWPMNIRELEQTVRAACALAGSTRIGLAHLPEAMRGATVRFGESDRALHDALIAALARHRGNISAVARDLGKARVQIRRWCRRFKIDPDSFR